MAAAIPDYTILSVEVDGDVALSVGRVAMWAGFPQLVVDTFERDPLTGAWRAVQPLFFEGRLPSNILESFEMDGDRAILPRRIDVRVEILVLERDPATGLWSLDDIISPGSLSLRRAVLSGDRVAMGFDLPERIEVWARTAGGWVLEDTVMEVGPTGWNFTTEFDLEGDRIVSNSHIRLDVYRRTPAGPWEHEVIVRAPEGYNVDFWFEPPFFTDGRWVQSVWATGSSGAIDALAFWRVSADGGVTRSVSDGVIASAALPVAFGSTRESVIAGGTMITRLEPGACSGAPATNVALAVVATGTADVPALRGWFCTLEGATLTSRARNIDYDGLTFAAAVSEVGVPNSVHFASLLGSDHDRDGDCVLDEKQVFIQPDLDRNGNGRLDDTESRGTAHCVPTSPNSSGTLAELRMIGSEFAPTTDLAALMEGLPPSTFGVLAVARSPIAGTPSGPFGLCIGGGTGGPFVRYPVFQADAQGVGVVDLSLTQLPGAAHVPGDTWGWQYVYRDGPGFGASPAVRVALQ